MTASLQGPSGGQETFRSLADEFIESWVCWREACEDVHGAYERWQLCDPAQRGLAFAGYRAALDREDQAARVHWLVAARIREARGNGHV
jgi:hypothetical protein